LQRRASGFIKSKPHRLRARLKARKPEENRPPEENEKRREEEILGVNREEDGPGRRPHFQTARITPFSDRR
jgi:hypothetical protein